MTQNAINSKNAFVQIVSTSLGTVQTITGVIPYDNTIPQNTEGDEVLTLAITPKFSTSNLVISFTSMITKDTSGQYIAALFQDTTANSLSSKAFSTINVGTYGIDLQYIMTSGTTSSTTFKIRVGVAANSALVNGNTVGQIFGGVAATKFTIIECL